MSTPATILLVDDDALIAMSTLDMLEDLGHTVIEAHSGPQALNKIIEGVPIDLVITDHAMPGMTGAELARQVRVLRPDLPILLATGYSDLPNGDGEGLPRLSKPYTQELLQDRIEQLLGR